MKLKTIVIVSGITISVAVLATIAYYAINESYNKGYEAGKIETIREVWEDDNNKCIIQLPPQELFEKIPERGDL